MTDIRHRISVKAPQEQVHRALTTTEGIGSWWTQDIEGDGGEGGKLRLSFGGGDRQLALEVVRVTPDLIEWRCLEGPDEWLPTTFTFELEREAGETTVLFTNAGWVEAVPFTHHCTTKWGSYFLGLKSLLEGGEAAPYPGDVHISSWD
jgi:uncharacterized protein YndB with AHSA1/START domain